MLNCSSVFDEFCVENKTFKNLQIVNKTNVLNSLENNILRLFHFFEERKGDINDRHLTLLMSVLKIFYSIF